jgi:hypothetical protein
MRTATARDTTAGGSDMKANGKPRKSDPSVSYDEFKEYEGRKYTGMKIGRSHKWYYDEGEWKETKVTPDLWQITYAVTKRRAGRAPEGSGVPVGTEYHWYVLAHQNVTKLNANDYSTSMSGLKFKIAHKRADNEKWSATEKTQRKRMIEFLQDVIHDLEADQERKPPRKKAAKKAARKKTPTAKKPPRNRRPATPPSMTKPVRRRRKTTTTSSK